LVEDVLDEVVLCFEEPDDFIGRLNNHFGHCVPPKLGEITNTGAGWPTASPLHTPAKYG
jgi:hypothetical protein